MNSDDELTPDQAERLRRARIDLTPPPELETRTVSALRARRLVGRRRRATAAAWLVASALLIAMAVWRVEHRAQAPDTSPRDSRFVLLLYAGDRPVRGAADDRRREYAAWARGLSDRGVEISGEELGQDRRLMGAGAVTLDVPRGFFVVRAPDLDAAERIAGGCPHLKYGGAIVVLPVVQGQ